MHRLEYVPGQPLSAHIPPEGLTLQQFFEWFPPLANALAHAHEHGVTHRDLKPGNIMISTEGIPKILDFGLAQLTRPEPDEEDAAEVDSEADTQSVQPPKEPKPRRLTRLGEILGTPAYMSPEQARGKRTDHRTDVFSFGVVLYEALTGRRVFEGKDWMVVLGRIVQEAVPAVRGGRPEVPEHLDKLVGRLVQKEQRRRYGALAGRAVYGVSVG